MAIDYAKVGWDTTKYVNPTNMNQMDNGIKAACDGVDALNVDMQMLSGYDSTTVYDDIPSMVSGVHASLSDQQSVCKNFRYSTSSALVIGNRFSSTRGRYLVLPRTNVMAYLYQIKDGNAYNTATLATLADLANYALISDLAKYALSSDVPKIRKGTMTVEIKNTTSMTGISFTEEFATVPTIILDTKYREYITVSNVTTKGFQLICKIDTTSVITTDVTWVAIE